MKLKKYILIMISVCIIICSLYTYSFAVVLTEEDNDFELELYSISGDTISPNESKDATKILQKTFGYTGNSLDGVKGKNTMKFKTKIKVVEATNNNNKFIIQIGQKGQEGQDDEKYYKPITMPKSSLMGVIKNYYTADELISKYGYPESKESLQEGKEWNVLLIGGGSEEQWVSGSGNSVADAKLVIKAYKLYSGSDYQSGEQEQIDTGASFIEVETIPEAIQNAGKKAIEFVLGKIFNMFIDLFRGAYGDGPQMILNTIQTSNYSTGFKKIKPWSISYKVDDILDDQNKNAYVNVSDDGSNEGVQGQAKKYEKAKENGLSNKTKIPILRVDLYYMATGGIQEFDVNFFSNSTSNQQSRWLQIRNNIVNTLLHVVIYIGAAFLIGLLIWRGISIVRQSIDPGEKAKHIEGLQSFVVSVIMLVGSIVIMNLCITFSDMIFDSLKVSETYEAPIRVILHDDNNIYSFSTNFTGYIRYMSEITKVAKIADKFMFTILYIVLVWLNIIAVICMFIRSIALMILSIIGPIIAVLHAINKENVINMTYQKWVMEYIKWTSLQLVFALIYKILLEVCF